MKDIIEKVNFLLNFGIFSYQIFFALRYSYYFLTKFQFLERKKGKNVVSEYKNARLCQIYPCFKGKIAYSCPFSPYFQEAVVFSHVFSVPFSYV